MAGLANRHQVEEAARKYLLEDGVWAEVRHGVALAERHPERARRIYELINGLVDRSEEERRQDVAEITTLLDSMHRVEAK